MSYFMDFQITVLAVIFLLAMLVFLIRAMINRQS